MLSARFAAVCVRCSGERKYYFTNHPADAPRMTLVRAIKARWACEQAHQQLKANLLWTIMRADPGWDYTIVRCSP
jgi:hypothetical protein